MTHFNFHIARILYVSIILLTSTWAFADGSASPQTSACLGPPGAPVQAIYMHGWFQPSGSGGYVQLEINNRKLLEKIAYSHVPPIRIAVPLAEDVETTSTGLRVRTWGSNYNLKSIEADAMQACGVTSLPKNRTLICFSDGAYKCQQMARSNCAGYSDYNKVLAIGAVHRESKSLSDGQRDQSSACPAKVTEIHHEPPNHRLHDDDIAGAIASPSSPAVASNPLPEGPSTFATATKFTSMAPPVAAAPATQAPVAPAAAISVHFQLMQLGVSDSAAQ
jgi:hypothetical protein